MKLVLLQGIARFAGGANGEFEEFPFWLVIAGSVRGMRGGETLDGFAPIAALGRPRVASEWRSKMFAAEAVHWFRTGSAAID